MPKINIALTNVQSGVAVTKSYFQQLLIGWKYYLPHSHQSIEVAGKTLKEENINIACVTEISESSLRTGFK